ncbi:MAG TPA: ABC transporter ATP-binding protein, partial [Planctomycetota bacterium]|nr:ABC transporter ATP-binding protein [Planctomycetota bacterium]
MDERRQDEGAAAPEPFRVRLRGVSCGYDRRTILQGVDLDVPRRGVMAFVGANGSGKTTLLRVLLGLLRPGVGRVEYGGRPDAGSETRRRPPRVGYVPQTDISEVLFPVTALEVVLMGLTPATSPFARPSARDREAA